MAAPKAPISIVPSMPKFKMPERSDRVLPTPPKINGVAIRRVAAKVPALIITDILLGWKPERQ
jgi:hypothetical protein